MICPNCMESVPTEVRNPKAIVCNGHGAHVVSAEPMDKLERFALLDHMNRSDKSVPHKVVPPT